MKFHSASKSQGINPRNKNPSHPKRKHSLKKENRELDKDLEDTFPASDPITKY